MTPTTAPLSNNRQQGQVFFHHDINGLDDGVILAWAVSLTGDMISLTGFSASSLTPAVKSPSKKTGVSHSLDIQSPDRVNFFSIPRIRSFMVKGTHELVFFIKDQQNGGFQLSLQP